MVPFSMGPLGSPIAHIGVELTDSPYVAVSMRIMTRMGQGALDVLGSDGDFVPCCTGVAPLTDCGGRFRGHATTPRYLALPRDQGRSGPMAPGYGGKRSARQKCFARASPRPWPAMAGWMTEHMEILGITSPDGDKALHDRRGGVPVGLR